MISIGPYTLYDFQESAVKACRQSLAVQEQAGCAKPRTLLVSPTGSGKTIVQLAFAELGFRKGSRVGFITSGRQLIFQAARTFSKAGIPISVLMSDSGDYYYDPQAQVQIVSKETLHARKDRIPFLTPDLWVVDEADTAISPMYLEILDQAKYVIGATATGCDGEGRGLGFFYRDLVIAASYTELIKRGTLVGFPEGNVFSPYRPDMRPAKMSGNEYSAAWLQDRMDKEPLVGDIVTEYKKHGDGKPFVVFCTGVQHSIHVRDCFEARGISCAHVDATTPQEERDEIFEDVSKGRIQGISNCAVLSRGFDCPALQVGILAKPTRRLRTLIQMVGRLMRSNPGKDSAKLIDHSGALIHHRIWPGDDVDWTLDHDRTLEASRAEAPLSVRPKEPYCCPNCAALRTKGHTCPNCGYKHVKRGQPVVNVDGVLETLKKIYVKQKRESSSLQKVWLQMLAQAAYRGSSYASASTRFKTKFGKWPAQASVSPTAKKHQNHIRVSVLWPGFIRRKTEFLKP